MSLKVILHKFNDRVNALSGDEEFRKLGHDFLKDEAGNDKLPSTDVIPQIFKESAAGSPLGYGKMTRS
jgi:hypothetical protein